MFEESGYFAHSGEALKALDKLKAFARHWSFSKWDELFFMGADKPRLDNGRRIPSEATSLATRPPFSPPEPTKTLYVLKAITLPI